MNPRSRFACSSLGRRLIGACLPALALASLACGPKPLEPTRGYILISIDTLRADRLGAYGYDKPTSPFIDSLAARGALFEHAYVHLPGTLPSHMSIFTGLYPEEHGVFPPSDVLSPEIKTLPEYFREAGYRTAGHTEGGYVDGDYGFARGFDEFDDHAGKVERDIEETFGRGVKFLESLGDDDSFFLFLHTYSVHDPYFPADEYLKQFWDRPKPDTFEPTGPNLVAYNRGLLEMDDEALEFFKASYDASIRYMDDVMKALFDDLERLGLSDQVTVILTSDHGEEFLEHGKMIHSQVYPELLHVPLIVVHPGLEEGRRISNLAQSVDIAPTLLDLAKIEIGGDAETDGKDEAEAGPPLFSGRSLVDAMLGKEKRTEEDPPLRTYALTAEKDYRSLIEQGVEGEPLRQLVFHEFNDRLWVEGETYLDTLGSTFKADVLSYGVPRTLSVEVDGEVVEELEIFHDAWKHLSLSFPEDGQKRRIVLRADGCVSPAELEGASDKRCLSFRLKGDGLRALELFDLLNDPLAAQDLSAEELSELRRLIRELLAFQPVPRAASSDKDLPPELVERLKALGYLQ